MIPQTPRSRQLSSRSIESLRAEKQELVDFIRERRAYLKEQEELIETVINAGNNQMLQMNLEIHDIAIEIGILRLQKIQLMRDRDDILFGIVTAQ